MRCSILSSAFLGLFCSGIVAAQSSSGETCTLQPHKGHICGAHGSLKHPQVFLTSSNSTFVTCRNNCVNTASCHSFSFDGPNHQCQLLSKPLLTQGFKKSSESHVKFYSKACYKCSFPSGVPSPTVSTVKPTTTSTLSGATTTGTPSTLTATNVIPVQTDPALVKATQQKNVQWAHDNDDDTSFQASATFIAHEGSALVNIEDFLQSISSAQCSNDQIVLSFSNSKALQNAKTWPQEFQLITSDPQFCGTADGARTLYNITSPTFVQSQVTLDATQVSLKEVGGVNITYGTTSSAPSGSRLRKRASSSTAFTIDTSSFSSFFDGENGVVIGENIQNGTIQCQDCGLFADVFFSGGAQYSGPGLFPTASFIELDFQNVLFNLDFSLSLQDGFDFSRDFVLASVPPELLPHVTVTGLIDIGPAFELVATVGIDAGGIPIEIDNIGFQATIAEAALGISTVDGFKSVGWDVSPQLLNPFLNAGTNAFPEFLTFSAAIGPRALVDVKVLSFLDFGGSFTLASPQITSTFTQVNTTSCAATSSTAALVNNVDASFSLTGAYEANIASINLGSAEEQFFDLSFPISDGNCLHVAIA